MARRRVWASLRWNPTGIDLLPSSAAIEEDGTQQVTAVVTNGIGRTPLEITVVDYSTSDADIATVDAAGLVTATGIEGACVITGTISGTSVFDTVTVSVGDTDPDTLVLTPATAALGDAETQQLIAVVTNQFDVELPGATVTYESDDEDVATVDEDGLVTAVGDGECVITATAGAATDTCAVTVAVAGVPAIALQLTGDDWSVDDPNAAEPDGYVVEVTDEPWIDDEAISGLTLTVVDGDVFAET